MQAKSRSPVDVSETLSLTAAYAKRGELDAALVLLKELLLAEPDHEIANGMLAGIYAQLKMTERAAEGYRRVLKINPQNPLARFQLGLLELTSGQPQEALHTLRPSLKDRQDFLAHFYSGLALMELNRPDEARELLQRAAERMPVDHQLCPQLRTLLEKLPPSKPLNS
jgi:Tfp pilus assembly protein PilF